MGVLRGDFGESYQDRHPISDTISERIAWTLLISGTSILLTYLISIPLGIFSATKRGTRTDNWLTTFLFALHSLPSFWVATLLVIFLCQPDYINWFPPYGLGNKTVAADGFWRTAAQCAQHLILPVFVVTYTQIAFLSRQMRGGLLQTLNADYIRTAHAKGLSPNTVVQKHAFRNAILPIITLFANIFPSLIAGSFVAESVFTLPGMGRLAYEAIQAHDYPTVFAVVLLAAFMTIIGYIIADLLYVVADPRIRLR